MSPVGKYVQNHSLLHTPLWGLAIVVLLYPAYWAVGKNKHIIWLNNNSIVLFVKTKKYNGQKTLNNKLFPKNFKYWNFIATEFFAMNLLRRYLFLYREALCIITIALFVYCVYNHTKSLCPVVWFPLIYHCYPGIITHKHTPKQHKAG